MTETRYNYLPHPISEYGVYRTQPEDSVMQILARKDQATWNFSYLTYPKLLDSWHNLHALPSSEEANTRAVRLLFDYNAINASIDGVSVRHQVLHLPPVEFVTWFDAVGGLSMLEGYGQGSPRIADKHVKAIQDFLPVTAKRLVAWIL